MLKLVIDKLEDVVEPLRDYYKEKDGKFYLQADGLKTQADIDKVLQAKTKEVSEHNATKAKLAEATEKLKVFGDLDPDTVLGQLTELETLKAAGPNAKADEINRKAEEIAATKYKTEQQKMARDLAKVVAERDAVVTENGTLKGSIEQRTKDEDIRSAAIAAKVLPEALGDVLVLARSDFKLVDGKVVTEDGRTPAQWLEDAKKSKPYLWPQSKGAGGQGGGNEGGPLAKDNPFSAEGWNLTAQGQLLKSNPTRANELATSAGTKIGGPRPVPAKAA